MKAGSSYFGEFTTQTIGTGLATDADALPVATVSKNGTDVGTSPTGWSNTLTVTNIGTGRYKVTGTVPSTYVPGDIVIVSIAASVGGVAGRATIDSFEIQPIDTGAGSVEVDHNYGSTDGLRLVEGALGKDGATVRAFLKTDWDADRRGDLYVKGRAITDVNGRWLAPMWLDAATYTFAFAKAGYATITTEVTIA